MVKTSKNQAQAKPFVAPAEITQNMILDLETAEPVDSCPSCATCRFVKRCLIYRQNKIINDWNLGTIVVLKPEESVCPHHKEVAP